MTRAKKPADVDPNKLKRERAGRYVTPDGRFAVEGESTGSWYIVDNHRENELGLPLMEGPFATLDDARAQVVALREGNARPTTPPAAADEPEQRARTKLRSLQGGMGRPKKAAKADADAEPDRATQADEDAEPAEPTEAGQRTVQAPEADAPPAKTPARSARRTATAAKLAQPEPAREPTWLERLPAAQQADARRLLAILERLGIEDPALVRRELEANLPEVARALLARRVQRDALGIWADARSVGRELGGIPQNVRRHLRARVAPALEAAERVLAAKGSPDDVAAFAWLVAVRTAGAVFDAIDGEGHESRVPGEPGWRLVELDGRREPTRRAITLDASDILEPDAD